MEHREDTTELLTPALSVPLSTGISQMLSRRSFLTRSGYSVATLLALSLWDGTGAPPALGRTGGGGGRGASAGQGFRQGARLGATPAGALQLPLWGDGANWDWPEYYETIQAARHPICRTIQYADIDGDGQEELLIRAPRGILANHFDAPFNPSGTGQWLQMPVGPALTDAAGWNQPQYYHTIQCADIDGDGRAELLARAAVGMLAWKFTTAGAWTQLLPNGPEWSDAVGWNQPQYYETIQCASINGIVMLLGRAPDKDPNGAGMQAWAYAPPPFTQWTSFGIAAPWTDAAGWNQPQYHRTIQCADVDNDGWAEVIGRAPDNDPHGPGIQIWHYEPQNSNTSWSLLPAGPPLTDAAGWNQPQYYRTIQGADINGDGFAEFVARGPGGILAWHYDPTQTPAVTALAAGPAWSDANGWNQPQYYETIQLADVDGDGAAELIGRAPDNDPHGPGIQIWKYDGTTNSWSQLPSGPAWTDAAGWDQVQYYGTIKTVRPLQTAYQGSPQQAYLLGRDSLGKKTWYYDPNQQLWQSASVAAFPAFSGDQLTAYNYLTSYWRIATGDVRDHYNDQTTVINTWLGDLQNNRIPAPSNVTTADWQAVTGQIQNELQAVSYVQDWFGSLTNTLITEIYLGQQMSVQTVGDYLGIPSGSGDTVALSILSLLFNGAWAVLSFEDPALDLEADAEAEIADIIGAAVAPRPGPSIGAVLGDPAATGGTYQGAYAGLQAALTNSFNQAITANGNNQQAITGGTGADPDTGQPVPIPGDYGLLMAIGQMVASTVWSWPASTGPLVTAAQRQYALSLWQALIGLTWWRGVDELDGPPNGIYGTFPTQYLYPPGYSVTAWWLTNSSTGFTWPATPSLSALFDAPAAGEIFPLGVPLSDIYLGQNGWPTLSLQDYTPNIGSGRPPYVPPSLGPELRVQAKLTRDAVKGEILAALTISNHGLSAATNVEVTGGRLGSKGVLAGFVPTRHTRLAPGKTESVLLRFPLNAGTAGEQAVLRLSGRYRGGTFGGSFRVTIP
jgi:hypothetical protein